jgi:hypothetical protein
MAHCHARNFGGDWGESPWGSAFLIVHAARVRCRRLRVQNAACESHEEC